MIYETVRGLTLPKIGFGTWKIGGGTHADPAADALSMAGLGSALEIGYTHFDTAEMYANGHSEELLGSAIQESRVGRETLFIATKVLPSHLEYDEVLRACENSLRHLKMEFVDLYLIHWPQPGMKLKDTFRALNKLVQEGKVKHLGVSNFNIKLLKEAQALSATPILTNQVPFSLSDRSYIKNGMLEYCQQNNLLLTAYSPVDEGRLRSTRSLDEIAGAHQASPYQIALAWIISHPRVITIPMSLDPKHILENYQAADIKLSGQEIKKLTWE